MVQKVFWYVAVLISNYLKNRSLKGLNLVKKLHFLYFKPILSAIFVTLATVKFK